ncbi:hypothetical protein NC651_014277 [Populus alba x Populus x berolinensis]|nr:hypothetical protein NC651_014277 [Populus alba x Populus x berolinensis]
MNPRVFVTYRYIVGSWFVFLKVSFSCRKAVPKLTIVLFLEIFVLSLLGLEIVDLRNPRGIAKIVGTVLTLAGVLTITLYKGPEVQSLQGAPIHVRSNHAQQNWVKGSFLLVSSCFTRSLYFIMQHIERSCCIIGLYMLLWGKENERDRNKSQEPSLSTYDEENLSQLAVESSAEEI